MYNFVHEWKGREKEREGIPCSITQQMEALLRSVDLLKFYEEATSLKGKSAFLQQVIHHWDHV